MIAKRKPMASNQQHNQRPMMSAKTISFRLLLLAAALVALALAHAQETPNAGSSGSPSRRPTSQTSGTFARTSARVSAQTTTRSEEETSTVRATEEPEAVTSVASEMVGANTDAADKLTTTTTTSETDETGDDSSALGGIEPKSISRGTNENSVGADNAKLTIDSAAAAASGSGESGETGSENGAHDTDAAGDETEVFKPRPVMPSRLNLTQIDQIFTEGHKEESETVESWKKMGRKLKKSISGLIGSLVPFALNMSQEAKISSNCSGAVLKWVLSMNQLKAWALRMLDASGKPIAGLLEGSMTMFGNYRQCLKVRAPDDDEIEFAGEFREYFRGKYCIIQAKPWLPKKERFYNFNAKLASLMGDNENESYDQTIFEELNEWLLAFNFVNIRFDLCVPSLCSREDIQKAVNFLMHGIDMKARVARCEMDLPDGAFGAAAVVETGSLEAGLNAETAASTQANAQVDFRSFGQLGWIILPLVALSLVLLSTILSLTIGEDQDDLDNSNASSINNNNNDDDTTTGELATKKNKLKHTIKSLSLKRSVGSHLNVDYDQLADDKPLALYGVRYLLVMWVIMVESAVNLKFEYLRELMMLKEYIFWWPMQIIINSTLQYESFILLTAFTMGYKNCLNDGAKNAKAITKFVADKYVRLMPSIMVMVALVILLPLIYRGPVWNDYVARQSAVCQSTGWLNSIFLQNYLPYSEICLPQTWLLCVELQLVLIMAPVVYYLNKSYNSSFGGNNLLTGDGAKIRPDSNGVGAKTAASSATSRRHDSSKPFHWLWTTPGIILTACIALGMGSSFYNVYSKQLPPSWFYTMADPDSKALYFGEHMTKLWTHLAVFAMGILAGVECRRATKNVQRGNRASNMNLMSHSGSLTNQHKSHSYSAASLPIMLAGFGAAADGSKYTANDGWTSNQRPVNGSSVSINIHHQSQNEARTNSVMDSEIGCLRSGSCETDTSRRGRSRLCSMLLDLVGFMIAITIMAALIFSTHDWSVNDLPRPLVAGLFDAGSRFLWSLAMIWILWKISVPLEDRSFSLLARALGHPAMVCLGKLSFLIYIIHPFVHTTVLAIQEQPAYSSWLMMFHILIGNITITVILASLVSLFVEMPCRNLFRRCGTSLLLTQSVRSDGGGSTTGSGGSSGGDTCATTSTRGL